MSLSVCGVCVGVGMCRCVSGCSKWQCLIKCDIPPL